MARQPKTARQRVEEALGVSQRKIDRAKKKRDDLAGQVKKLDVEIAAEEKQRAWLQTHPALPPATVPKQAAPS